VYVVSDLIFCALYCELEHRPDPIKLILQEDEIALGLCLMLSHKYLEVGRRGRRDSHDLIQFDVLGGVQVAGTLLCARIYVEFNIGNMENTADQRREVDL
jgi:hypothetical protein